VVVYLVHYGTPQHLLFRTQVIWPIIMVIAAIQKLLVAVDEGDSFNPSRLFLVKVIIYPAKVGVSAIGLRNPLPINQETHDRVSLLASSLGD
jgi:hypothetical protein